MTCSSNGMFATRAANFTPARDVSSVASRAETFLVGTGPDLRRQVFSCSTTHCQWSIASQDIRPKWMVSRVTHLFASLHAHMECLQRLVDSSTTVVYQLRDEELLAYQSPHKNCFREARLPHISVSCITLSLCNVSPICTLCSIFRECISDRRDSGWTATLRTLQFGLAYDGAAFTDVMMEVVVCDDARQLGFAETAVPRRVSLPSGWWSDNSMNGVADRIRMSGNTPHPSF